MKYLVFLLTFLPFINNAQNDPKADAILDKVSAKMKSYSSFYIEFSAKTVNKSTGLNDAQTGKGWVKGNKYCASFGDNTILSNGMKTWTVVKEEKAVYEADASEDDEEGLNPKKLMTIWESGFKSKYEKETAVGNETCHEIKLFPTNAGDVEYHTVVVYVSKSSNNLKKAVMKMKDGTTMTYHLTKFEANTTVADSQFVFNSKKYPGYTVIRD